MTESIHTYFQIGSVVFMAYPSCQKQDNAIIPAIKKLANDDYFDAVELNPISNLQTRAKVSQLLASSHMKICYSAHGRLLGTGLNPNSLDETMRKKAEQTLFEGIDEAAELGASTMSFLAGTWEQGTTNQAIEQLLKTTKNLCAYAAEKNIFIELEVFDFDIAKKSLMGPAPRAAQFAAEVRKNHANFGLMADLSHMPMCYEKPEFTMRELRPYITHFHLGNTVISSPVQCAYGDEHPRFGFSGSEHDTAQVLQFLKILKDEGFFNKNNPYILSFEVKPVEGEDPDTVLSNSKRVLNRAWALLN